MTYSDIHTYIDKIKNAVEEGNNEQAHVYEDMLMIDFIRVIAKRDDHIGKKARLILTMDDIEYDRWYL